MLRRLWPRHCPFASARSVCPSLLVTYRVTCCGERRFSVTGTRNFGRRNITQRRFISNTGELLKRVNDKSSFTMEGTFPLLPNVDLVSDTIDLLRTLKNYISRLDEEKSDEAFFMCDLGQVIERYFRWKRLFPKIHPLYVVSSNDTPEILRLLAYLGVSFCCASENEVSDILATNVRTEKILYDNPDNPEGCLRYLARQTVPLITIECEEDLVRIKQLFPDAHLLLRLRSHFAGHKLSETAEGCERRLNSIKRILRLAKDHGLTVVGVSFPVTQDINEELLLAKESWNWGLKLGLPFSIFSVVENYPGESITEEILDKVMSDLNELLNSDSHDPLVTIFADASRYLASSAVTAAVKVIARRQDDDNDDARQGTNTDLSALKDGTSFTYYVNDGVYGSFAYIINEEGKRPIYPLCVKETAGNPLFQSTIWGPTCDSVDLILRETHLPELKVGDWLYFKNHGSYTLTMGTPFNGMARPRLFFYSTAVEWKSIFSSAALQKDNMLPMNRNANSLEMRSENKVVDTTGIGVISNPSRYLRPVSLVPNARDKGQPEDTPVRSLPSSDQDIYSVDLLEYNDDMAALVDSYAKRLDMEGKDEPFFLCDLGDIIKKYRRWFELFPRIKPFYAVKCNDQPAVLRLLADLGLSFDCASDTEVNQIMAAGVGAERIIFANPCKSETFLRLTARLGIRLMTFDNEEELVKIKQIYPEAELLLRIKPEFKYKSVIELSDKFGCRRSHVRHLLCVARDLNLAVLGVSFHVGYGVEAAEAFGEAVVQAKEAWDVGLELGFPFTLLDVGGGFPGEPNAAITVENVAKIMNSKLDSLFPEDQNLRIIAEPGQYFVASAFTSATKVIARRTDGVQAASEKGLVNEEEPHFTYHLNDGVFGSFSYVINEHGARRHQLFCVKDTRDAMRFRSTLLGPTTNAMDVLWKDCQLPELAVGDWLFFRNNGAYTLVISTEFNHIPRPRAHFFCLETLWRSFYGNDE